MRKRGEVISKRVVTFTVETSRMTDAPFEHHGRDEHHEKAERCKQQRRTEGDDDDGETGDEKTDRCAKPAGDE